VCSGQGWPRSARRLLQIRPAAQQQRVTVVGDTHGQYHDLCRLLELFGPPSSDRVWVFNGAPRASCATAHAAGVWRTLCCPASCRRCLHNNASNSPSTALSRPPPGDYVDRGAWGVEVLVLLLAWKLCLPSNVWLTRGNHVSLAAPPWRLCAAHTVAAHAQQTGACAAGKAAADGVSHVTPPRVTHMQTQLRNNHTRTSSRPAGDRRHRAAVWLLCRADSQVRQQPGKGACVGGVWAPTARFALPAAAAGRWHGCQC
jgi:hypothetical protein